MDQPFSCRLAANMFSRSFWLLRLFSSMSTCTGCGQANRHKCAIRLLGPQLQQQGNRRRGMATAAVRWQRPWCVQCDRWALQAAAARSKRPHVHKSAQQKCAKLRLTFASHLAGNAPLCTTHCFAASFTPIFSFRRSCSSFSIHCGVPESALMVPIQIDRRASFRNVINVYKIAIRIYHRVRNPGPVFEASLDCQCRTVRPPTQALIARWLPSAR